MSQQTAQFLMSRFLLPHLPTWIIFAPFEVLRTHLQAGTIPNGDTQSLISSFRFLFETKGFSGLYQGNSLRILYSVSRFICVVPLELFLLGMRPLLQRINVSSHYSLLLSMVITLGLNQAYTYPIIYIRNEVILKNKGAISTFWTSLSTEGFHGLFYGLEGTYLGLIPAILAYRFINRSFFFSKTKYNKIIADLDLQHLPHLQTHLFDSDGSSDDEWDEIWDEEAEEEEEEAAGDEQEDNELPPLDVHQELTEMEELLDEQIEEEVLLQVERCLARMKPKHWKQFIRIGFRAFLTRTSAKLGMRLLCYPGDVLGKVMQLNHFTLSQAVSSVWNTQGIYGFFRGASIELLLTPLQIALEMSITVCAIRYNWGGKLFQFLFPSEENPIFIVDPNARPSPGKN